VSTLAVVVVVAGCGGSSQPRTISAPGASATGAGSTSSAGGHEVAAAKNRGFVTVIPAGYRRVPTQAEYLVSGAEEEGLAATVIVVRAPAGRGGDIGALARRTIAALRTSPRISQLSGPQALSVDGRPALAIEDVVAEGAGTRHGRLVLVRNGAWVYRILDLALPSQLHAAQAALSEVIGNWRWT
jgi:hypothetical protein